MERFETMEKQWAIAMGYLREKDITPTDERMTFTGSKGHESIVIHSKALRNCIHIGPKMTAQQIRDAIDLEIRIAEIHTKKMEVFKRIYPELNPYSSEGIAAYNALTI